MCNAAVTVINSQGETSGPTRMRRTWESPMQKTITGLAGALLLTACGQSAEPAQSAKDFMAQHVQPTAKVYWDSVQFISDETGDHDIFPKTDAEWERTRKAAVDLTAFGNLLQTPAYAEGRGKDWTQFAQGLVDIGKQAEQAALHKNPDEVFEVGGTMYNVCSACHQAYPAETPGPEATNTGAGA